MTPEEAGDEIRRYSTIIDAGLHTLAEMVVKYATAERDYRKGKAQAWVEASVREGTAGAKQAWVDGQTSDLRFDRDVADGMRQAALEGIRSRRAQVSAIQSLLAAHRAEAEFSRTT